jgi:hypothetical protein
MTEIGGFSELLLSGTRPDDPMHEDLAHVNRASRMAITALQALAGRSNGHAARQNTSV